MRAGPGRAWPGQRVRAPNDEGGFGENGIVDEPRP